MTKQQYKDGMRLGRLLRRVPEKNWDMTHFSPYSRYDRILQQNAALPSSEKKAFECGTACCVGGWAAYQNRRVWERDSIGNLIIHTGSFKRFYGISSGESERICLNRLDMSPKEKAQQVEEIIDRYSARLTK